LTGNILNCRSVCTWNVLFLGFIKNRRFTHLWSAISCCYLWNNSLVCAPQSGPHGRRSQSKTTGGTSGLGAIWSPRVLDGSALSK
jgi:hypothetical protein